MSLPTAPSTKGPQEDSLVRTNLPKHVDTLIFVDVDGVLNVCVRDSGAIPLAFNKQNMNYSFSVQQQKNSTSDREAAELIRCTFWREVQGEEEGSTYAKYLSDESTELTDVFTCRLAKLIQAAGDRQSVGVILSSAWRQSGRRIRLLEEKLSHHMGDQFAFDAVTPLGFKDTDPSDRLKAIGDFLAVHCSIINAGASGTSAKRSLRVLVLDDFQVNAMDTWIDSVEAVEKHLVDQMPSVNAMDTWIDSVEAVEKHLVDQMPSVNASVKIIHTYDEWTTSRGIHVQLGSGLTLQHSNAAAEFLGKKDCSKVQCQDINDQVGRQHPECEHPQPQCSMGSELLVQPKLSEKLAGA
eukprot:gnl/TRDRNA2_/TRDRNA2_30879_c0_seq1.p1 gnl/TRDRNA2_/TRDRNA2_30879_c0~~gnl/TRDRNA2_/TRDRNA2_30879_c0_seq1.p1  ORF type:complete len:352 (+),score=51.33 gnl/TRDRNA2_/TRDRNA2_30879_c0_seq1:90-1145(+)